MKLSGRNLAGWLLANLLILSGFVRRATKKALRNEHLLAICFHKPSRKEFESCVRWFKNNGFTLLSIAQLEKIIRRELPFPKGGVVLTIDDGWLSNETNVVRIADQYGVPVAIYISTEAVEQGTYWWSYIQEAKRRKLKPPSEKALKTVPNEERLLTVNALRQTVVVPRVAMTIEQVKRIARSANVTIGCHTHSHPILPNCTTAQVYAELSVSKQKLESWIGREVTSFAYPNGDFGQREIQILAELHFQSAFSMQLRYLTPGRIGDRFNLPRFGFLEGASFAENTCRMVGIWKPFMLRLKKLYPGNTRHNPYC